MKRHLNSGFTEAQEEAMVTQYQGGESSVAVSKKFGCQSSTVRRIIGRRGVPIRRNYNAGKLAGERHPQWKGGKTKTAAFIRFTPEYKAWRKAVFERDGYACRACGASGCFLHADHIFPQSLFPELRFSLDNGRTLCVPCHKETPTYLNSKMKRADFLSGG